MIREEILAQCDRIREAVNTIHWAVKDPARFGKTNSQVLSRAEEIVFAGKVLEQEFNRDVFTKDPDARFER